LLIACDTNGGTVAVQDIVKYAKAHAFLCLFAASGTFMSYTQEMPEATEGAEPGGVHLRSISAFSTGYSNVAPYANPDFGSPLNQLGGDVANGGAFLIDARRTRPITDAWLSYSGSYTAMMRYSDLRAYNQFFSGGLSWRIKPRWTLSVSGMGMDTTALETLLNPGIATAFRTTPVSMEQLAEAAASGTVSNGRIASYFTGSPFVSSPTQLLLTGRRLMTASITTTLTWNHSSRLRFYTNGLGVITQQRPPDRNGIETTYQAPRTVVTNVDAGSRYQLTRLTEIGFSASLSRTQLRGQHTYVSTALVSLGRRMSPRWFVYGEVGGGIYVPVAGPAPIGRDPRIIGNGQIGYQRKSHTLTTVFTRTLADPYGFGIGRQQSITGNWVWQRKAWGAFASAGHQEIDSSGFGAIRGWNLSSGITRYLTSHLSVQVQQAWLQSSGTFEDRASATKLHSIRISLNWMPNVRIQNP
jgi:hypothetical protein